VGFYIKRNGGGCVSGIGGENEVRNNFLYVLFTIIKNSIFKLDVSIGMTININTTGGNTQYAIRMNVLKIIPHFDGSSS